MKRFLIFFLPVLISLNSCSSLIKVKFLKPAEINIGKIKKIAVAEFPFNEASENSDNKVYSVKSISNILIKKIYDNGYFKVINSNETQTINSVNLKEKLLILKNNPDIEAIIFGSGNYSINDSGEWQDKNNDKKYVLKRIIKSTLNYQVISTSSGNIIASKNNSINNSETFIGKNENSVQEKLKNWKKIVDSQVDYLTSLSVNQLAPHLITEEREIKDGKNNRMKNAYEYARRGFWDDAKKNWEEIVRDETNLSDDMKDDAISAIYNLGVYYEVMGELENSEEMYQRAYDKTFNKEYLDYKNKVKKRRLELKKLQHQNIDIKN